MSAEWQHNKGKKQRDVEGALEGMCELGPKTGKNTAVLAP